MRTFLITTLLLLLYGCSTTGSIQVKTDLSDIKAAAPMLTETSTDTVAYDGNLLLIHSPYCDSLDSKRRTWSAITAVAGALAGSSAIIATQLDDDSVLVAEITGAVLAGFSALSVYLSTDYENTYQEQGCLSSNK